MQARRLFALAGSIVAPFAPFVSSALAQPECAPIVTADGGAGIGGANSMLRWDLDGQGPKPPAIVVFSAGFAGGYRAPDGAFWDGTDWRPLELSGTPTRGRLIEHQGQLQVFSHRLSGTTWEPLNVPFPLNSGTIGSMVSFGDRVAAVRTATSEVNPITVRTVNYATGETENLGAFAGAAADAIAALLVFNGELHAAGSFTTIDQFGVSSKVVRYDASTQSWQPVGALTANVRALGVVGGSLVAAGRFTTAAGERSLVRLVNGSWEPFGPVATGSESGALIESINGRSWFSATDPTISTRQRVFEINAAGEVLTTHLVIGTVTAVAPSTDGVYVTGDFNQLLVPNQTEQLHSMQNIARIDIEGVPRHVSRTRATFGIEFGPLSTPLNQVHKFSMYQGSPVAVGRFVGPINSATGHVAIMDSNGVWQPMGANVIASGIVSPEVDDAIEFQGNFYIAGAFRLRTGPSTTIPGRLARWTGSTWELAANVQSSSPFPIGALHIHDGRLIVGGAMTSINGVATGNVATWDGTTWASIGANFPGTVWSFETFQDDLYAGGSGGTAVARWSGTDWQPLGLGLQGAPRDVFQLQSHNGKLYVGGMFTSAGGLPNTAGVAAWSGSAWSPLNVAGRPQFPAFTDFALTSMGKDLVLAASSGNGSAQLPFARTFLYNEADGWREILTEPSGANYVSTAEFIDGSLFLGGLTRVSQSHANIHLQRLQFPCPICDSIDFNNDGSLFDPTDVDAFLSVFSEGPCIPATATCNDTDFNNDGSLFDPQEIAAFLSVFSEGPCL